MSDSCRSLIALGGNLSVTADTFRNACGSLSRYGVQVVNLSSVFRTAAVGRDAGAEFLNAAAIVESSLAAPQLLQVLHTVEKQFGRERLIHWGPRTLDLDLLLFEQAVIDQPEIVVPHPAMWYRQFVLQPAAEIAGELSHPLLKQSVQQLWVRIQTRPLTFRICVALPQGGSLADSQQQICQPADFQMLEELCRKWQVLWSADHVRFVPTVETSEHPTVTDAFATIRLTSPRSADHEPPTTGKQPPVHRRFTLNLILNESVEQTVRDIVTSALG